MDYLDINDGRGNRQRVALDRPRLVIGRDPTCEVCLPHASVSRRHAQLQKTDEGLWLIQDLNSLNHVYGPDGTQVTQGLLEPGQTYRIAEYRLTLEMTDTPTATADPLLADLTPVDPEDDSRPSWPGLDPGWLEQLQRFQRELL